MRIFSYEISSNGFRSAIFEHPVQLGRKLANVSSVTFEFIVVCSEVRFVVGLTTGDDDDELEMEILNIFLKFLQNEI